MSSSPVRLVAFYLPQFHPIPENDKWWGKGFTEWTNVAKARRLFPGHYQPHIPADLGFYDLRMPEARLAQAKLAREYGISAFCYYHYWFAGRRILERPFKEVLASGKPDFPFCLCWANQSWTGVWHGNPNRVLIEQIYPGVADHKAHFAALLPAFRDRRYFRVDGEPMFVFYQPKQIPGLKKVLALWRRLAADAGLPGLYLVGCGYGKGIELLNSGLDAVVATLLPPLRKEKPDGKPSVYPYGRVAPRLVPRPTPKATVFPCVIPGFDNTPRSGSNGLVLHGSTPELFGKHLKHAIDAVRHLHGEERIVFVKSWNEWAEGNYLEPDLKSGRAYLETVRATLESTGGKR